MAIISSGYEGTVNEAQWSDLLAYAGGRQYAVADAASWAVSVGAADREVRIAVGRGFGYGVRDLSDTVVPLIIPAATSGSRYDLIVAHRDWQANTTTFTRIAGTSARELPARAQTPGTVDDQPVALVRVTAGQSQVTEIVDLRVWGGDGGAYARDELVLQYVNRLGTNILINGVEWTRVLNSLGAPVWRRSILRQAGFVEGATGGGVVGPGATSFLVNFTIPVAIPVGALFHAHADAEMYLPAGNDYAGFLQFRGPTTVLQQRRWHSHGRGLHNVFPSVEYNTVVTEEIAAGTRFALATTSDQLSNGGFEVWDAAIAWSVS